MDKALLEFLAAAPMQVLLILAIVALWRENRRLADKLDAVYNQSKLNGATLYDQNREIEAIKTHVTGMTPPRGTTPIKLSDN